MAYIKTYKKAQVASQFNWIYILVVGGLILGLFFAMSTKQSKISEVKISATALEGITTIFDSARTGNSLSTVVNVPDITIEFSCDDTVFGKYSDYSVGGLSRKIPTTPVFSPKTLSGKNIITWTLSWNMPFKIMNFLFLSNTKTRFYFLFGSKYREFKDLIEESFSDNMKFKFIETKEEVVDLNDDMTVIVLVDDTISGIDISSITKGFANDVRILEYFPVGTERETAVFGEVNYMDKEGVSLGNPTYYFGLASFYATIFTDNPKYYECVFNKAVKRMGRVYCVYLNKFKQMADAYSSTKIDCQSAYMGAVTFVESYFGNDFCSVSGNENDVELGDLPNVFENKYQDEYNLFSALETQNKRAIGESCEPIY